MTERRRDDRPSLDGESVSIPPGHAWNRVPWIAGAIGLVGVGLSLALGGADPRQFYFSWLVAFLFYLTVALGALFFVLSHFVTGASWSVVLRRLAENVMASLPLFVLLFVPVAVGLHDLFSWTHEELPEGKRGFLNTDFFLVRAGIYFASWSLLAFWFLRQSARQDQTRDPRITRRLIQQSAPALFVFAVTVSLAAVDWIMSLDAHWYSTIFGVYFFAGSLVGIFAVLSILAVALRRAGLLSQAITTEHLHDLGKLLFAFMVFWTYIAFSQYFLIWYGNIPEETIFYRHRLEGSWRPISLLLAVGHFVVPFFFLMPRSVKRHGGLLVVGSLWMLLMHLLDLHWLVMPTLHPHGAHFALLDLTTLVGVGGLFVAFCAWQMRRRALVPVGDPRLGESLQFENV